MKKKNQIYNIQKQPKPSEIMESLENSNKSKKIANAVGAGIMWLIGLANLAFAFPFEETFDFVHLGIALSNIGLSTVWIKDAIKASKNEKLFAEQAEKARKEELSEQSAPQA